TSSSAASRSSGSCSARGSRWVSSRAGAARGTGPRPIRTVRKSASVGRRSQRRSVWATAPRSSGGSGWRWSATASCPAARWSACAAVRGRGAGEGGRARGAAGVGEGELSGGEGGGLCCRRGEVGEVAAPGPVGGAAFEQTEREPGGDRGDGGADDEGDQPDRAGAGDGEQERDRSPAAGQRDQVLEPAGPGGGGPAEG